MKLKRFFIAAIVGLLGATQFISARSPNIIFILVDDQGYYDVGCYGATEVTTPRIDLMAKEGVRFTDYYAAAPICSPSRAGLITGRYQQRHGWEFNPARRDLHSGMNLGEETLAEALKEQG